MTHRSFMTASLLLTLLAVDTTPAAAQARGRVAPRGGSPQVGRAAPRVGPPPRAVRPVYRGYGYRGYGYRYRPAVRVGVYTGFGYGYPYGHGAYPYGYFGFGYGYPYYAARPYAYSYVYPYAYSGYGAAYWGSSGGVRIRGAQPDAEVLVDGYYAGIVDDFDGSFQQLRLEAGPHRVEIRTPNGPPLTFEVNVIPGQTITYRATP